MISRDILNNEWFIKWAISWFTNWVTNCLINSSMTSSGLGPGGGRERFVDREHSVHGIFMKIWMSKFRSQSLRFSRKFELRVLARIGLVRTRLFVRNPETSRERAVPLPRPYRARPIRCHVWYLVNSGSKNTSWQLIFITTGANDCRVAKLLFPKPCVLQWCIYSSEKA